MGKAKHLDLTLNIKVLNLTGTSWIATSKVGGVTLRGARADDPVRAVVNLFWAMTPNSSTREADDAAVGIELALAGTTIEEQLSDVAELSSGIDDDDARP